MKKLYFIFIILPICISSQVFDRAYVATTNFAVGGNDTQHIYDTIGGTYILSGTNATASTGIIIKINKFGDTLWSRKVHTQPGKMFYPEGFIKLNNGNLLLTGYYYGSGFSGVGFQTYNSNGSFIGQDSVKVESLVAYGFKACGVDNLGNYYLGYRNDSIDPSVVDMFNAPINKYWRTYLEKRDQNNNLIWQKKYETYTTITNPAPYEIISSLCLNNDNSLIVNVSYGRLEKYNLSGVLQYTLNPSAVYTPTNIFTALIINVFPAKDSSYILSCQVNDTSSYVTNYRFALNRYSANGTLLDSASFLNSYMVSLCESLNNDLIINYYTYSSIPYAYGAGIIITDKQFNLKANYPFTFGYSALGNPNGYAYTGNLSANDSGGAFYAAVFNTNGNSSYLNLVSFDSLMNTYPNKLAGKLILDNDKNCLSSAPDYSITGGIVQAVDASNQSFIAISNSAGNYSLNLPTGTYTLQHTPASNKASNCTGFSTPFIASGATNATIHYFDTLIPNLKDVELASFLTSRKPGDTTSLSLYYKNSGSNIFNGFVKVKKDSTFQNVYSSPMYNAINGDTLIFNVTNLKPDSSSSIYVQYKINTTAVIGSTLNIYSVINQNGDITPWNNYDSIQKVASYISPKLTSNVSSGFKSNSIQVNKPLMIDGNEQLVYRINFQNTNKKTVKKVIIVDSLSQKLDLSTFKIVKSSHPYKSIEIKKNILYVTYDNINLKDSTVSTSQSIGEFVYSLKPKPNLSQGTFIKNKCLIIFDLFPQKETNIVSNKIKGYYVGIKENKVSEEKNDIILFPNPTNNITTIIAQNSILKTVEVMSMDGKIIKSQFNVNSQTMTLNVENLPAGIYLLKTNTNKGSFTSKLIKIN